MVCDVVFVVYIVVLVIVIVVICCGYVCGNCGELLVLRKVLVVCDVCGCRMGGSMWLLFVLFIMSLWMLLSC